MQRFEIPPLWFWAIMLPVLCGLAYWNPMKDLQARRRAQWRNLFRRLFGGENAGDRIKGGLATRLLDAVLFLWPGSKSPFTARHLVSGGVAILGRTSAGKTSGSGKYLAEAIVRQRGTGGLILAAKIGEDLAMWRGIFEKAERKDDLLVFGPGHHLRWNFIDSVLKTGGDTREITQWLMTIRESLGGASDDGGGEHKAFWRPQEERMIYNAVQVVKLATGKVDPVGLQRFITGAAQNPEQLKDENWQKQFHCRTVREAMGKPKTPEEEHDFTQAVEYWFGEIPGMADKTRSCIMTGVTGILHVYNSGIVRSLVSGETNACPADMFRGKFLFIDAAPAEYGDSGRFLSVGAKGLAQRAILKRQAGPDSNLVVLWGDEFPNFFTSMDSRFVAECRSHLGCMVVLAQGRDSFYSMASGQKGRAQVDQFLAQFHHKVFHALGSAQDAEYAAGLIGKSLQTFLSSSMAPTESAWDELMGNAKVTTSTSEHFESVLQANVFMNGLRTGGPENRFLTDAIVVRSGEPFADGRNYLKVTFNQKG